MMNDDQLSMDEKAIELCKDVNLKAADKFRAGGISPENIARASILSSFGIAEVFTGDAIAAIEWLRTGLDVIEANVMAERDAQASRGRVH